MFGRTAPFIAMTALLGCARIAGSTYTPALPADPLQPSPEVITKHELSKTHGLTVYEAVTRFRPNFLNPAMSRDVAGVAHKPVVYVDGAFAGDASVLRQMSADIVMEVRYVRPREAVTRHGDVSRGGEILIYTNSSRAERWP